MATADKEETAGLVERVDQQSAQSQPALVEPTAVEDLAELAERQDPVLAQPELLVQPELLAQPELLE